MSESQSSGMFSGRKSEGLVLVVDDESDVRKVVRMTLEKSGYNVLEAEDGAQAIAEMNKDEQDFKQLICRSGTHLIVNVTGDPSIDEQINTHKHLETEVLGGAASKVLWDLIRDHSQMQAQVFQAEKLAGMGTFASGIAHDINNPLYILLAFSENILDETDTPTIHQQARSIIDAGKRIQSISQNITRYARAAKIQDAATINVRSTLDEALKIAQFATMFQDISIVRNYEDNLEVLANSEELFQVFVNLMTNAIHAMKGRGNPDTLILP